jgi:phage gp45-like
MPMHRLKKLIQLVRITAGGLDDKDAPVQQIEYMGKVASGVMVFPFGFHANVDPDSLGIKLSYNAQPENRAVFPFSFLKRPKHLATGEVVVYHPKTGTKIHFRDNGDIDVVANTAKSGNVNITCNDVTVNAAGDAKIDAVGDVTLLSDGFITIDSSTSQITIATPDEVHVQGTVKVKLEGASVELHDGGTIRKLVNELVIDLFNDHTHGLASGGNFTTKPVTDAPTRTGGTPMVWAVDTETTTVTKAE